MFVMDSNEALREQLYVACLRTVLAMGSDIKGMSWFGRNVKHVHVPEGVSQIAKAA
jgi:hypothetical protein